MATAPFYFVQVICLGMAFLFGGGGVRAAIPIYEAEDCMKCVAGTLDPTNTYRGVCRSQFGSFSSYCCSEEEADWTKGKSSTCQNMPFCTWDTSLEEMQYLACPHVPKRCGGILSPNIRLSLGESVNVVIGDDSTFSMVDSCFYKLTTYDQINEADLDPYNRKYMQVFVNSVTALDIFVAVGLSEGAIQEAELATGTRFNFTYPNTANFYVVAKPQ